MNQFKFIQIKTHKIHNLRIINERYKSFFKAFIFSDIKKLIL